MPEVPFKPAAPPAQPTPAAPSPAPVPAVPVPPTPVVPPVLPSPPPPPPTIPPPAPAPAPLAPKPAPTPPIPPPAPIPAPQPAASPAPTPLPKNPHPHHILTGLFVLLCALGVIGILLLIFLPTLQRMIPQLAPPKVSTVLPPVATTTQTPAPAATSTVGATSTAPAYQEPSPTIHKLGETTRLFANDTAIYANRSGTMFHIQVQQFTDSRCAKGNTCIWAGERGVILLVTDTATNQTATIALGMVRMRSGNAFGLTFTLKEIDDEKGGTYADITVR